MKIKSIILFLSFLLLLSSFTTPATACCEGDPPGECYVCEDTVWVQYGDCWGGCPECESCVSCYCECTSECCTDLDCEYGGEGCESCDSCSCVDDDSKCTGECHNGCSGGSCVDDDTKCNVCQVCSDGDCVPKPGAECGDDDDCGPCKECNLETCFCDDICIECQECVEGHCISCGALGKVCCDSFCEEPCVEEDDETTCSAVNNRPCQKCVGTIIFKCSSVTTDIYTNATTYDCSGGCYGDCAEVQGPVCYRTYKCKTTKEYNFYECTSMQETGPVPLDCYPGIPPQKCKICGPDYDQLEDEYHAGMKKCQ